MHGEVETKMRLRNRQTFKLRYGTKSFEFLRKTAKKKRCRIRIGMTEGSTR